MFAPEDFLGAFRFLRCLLLRREVVVEGGCRRCGECCRSLVLFADGGPVKSDWHFEELCQENEGYRRFVIQGQTPSGALLFGCRLLQGGSCSRYEDRLDFCRRYPSVNLYFSGYDPIRECGFRFVERPRGRSGAGTPQS